MFNLLQILGEFVITQTVVFDSEYTTHQKRIQITLSH